MSIKGETGALGQTRQGYILAGLDLEGMGVLAPGGRVERVGAVGNSLLVLHGERL